MYKGTRPSHEKTKIEKATPIHIPRGSRRKFEGKSGVFHASAKSPKAMGIAAMRGKQRVTGKSNQQSTVSRLHSIAFVRRPPFVWTRRTATIQSIAPRVHEPSSPTIFTKKNGTMTAYRHHRTGVCLW